ncbi:MAG: 2-oxoacid:acceptor oxidoreductase family protein [Deltaproteobacteria bacterium]|jgi:2-oxoglutarate ferredoxin oxidoreductase subunit gamma|nr:2-oxoacid:acceptor oxidoreductase family protein [Deltaproteobacteria bacterium]
MAVRKEALFSGFGGQGVVLAGRSLGLAAVIGGLEATMLVNHGTETRGGYVRSQVVISDEEIDSPLVERPDILLALSQAAYNRFKPLAAQGLTLFDPDLVRPGEFPGREAPLMTRKLALELGSELAANMVALGKVLKLLGLVPLEAARQAIRELSKRGLEINLAAL